MVKWLRVNPSANFGPKHPCLIPPLIYVRGAILSLDRAAALANGPKNSYTEDILIAVARAGYLDQEDFKKNK